MRGPPEPVVRILLVVLFLAACGGGGPDAPPLAGGNQAAPAATAETVATAPSDVLAPPASCDPTRCEPVSGQTEEAGSR